MSLTLLAQAWDRCRLAPYVSVATLAKDASAGRDWAKDRLREKGIGVILVGENKRVHEPIKPLRQNGVTGLGLLKSLRPEHTNGDYAKAGSTTQAIRFTPWRATCKELREIAKANPGCKLSFAVSESSTGKFHYQNKNSARSALSQQLLKGEIEGIKYVDGSLYLLDE